MRLLGRTLGRLFLASCLLLLPGPVLASFVEDANPAADSLWNVLSRLPAGAWENLEFLLGCASSA